MSAQGASPSWRAAAAAARSSPSSRGPARAAKLLVGADGERYGSLGDEALEDAAAQHADELMWLERSERREEGGTCCSSTPPSRRRG